MTQAELPGIERLYIARSTIYGWHRDYWEHPSARIVRVLCRGRGPGPRNVLVELAWPQYAPASEPVRWVRPGRGLRRLK